MTVCAVHHRNDDAMTYVEMLKHIMTRKLKFSHQIKIVDPRIKIPYVLFIPTLSISKTQFWYLNYATFYFIYGSYILIALLLNFGNWYRKRKLHGKCNMFNKIFKSSLYVILCLSYISINTNCYIMH